MGKLVVSLDGVVIKEVQITKDKTTLGRRPYNDIVIDNLAVSGEHAVLQMVGADVFIGRELDPADRAVNGPGERLGQQGLAHPGDVLNQQVPLGEQDGQSQPDRLGLSLDDRLHGAADFPCDSYQVVQRPVSPTRVKYHLSSSRQLRRDA